MAVYYEKKVSPDRSFAREIVACVVRFDDFWLCWLAEILFWRMVGSIFVYEIVACVVRFDDFWLFWLAGALFWRMVGLIFAHEIVACVILFGDIWQFWLAGTPGEWWGRCSLAKSWPAGIFQRRPPK